MRFPPKKTGVKHPSYTTYYYENIFLSVLITTRASPKKIICFAIWAQSDFLKFESSNLPLFWHTMNWSTFGSLPETKEI